MQHEGSFCKELSPKVTELPPCRVTPTSRANAVRPYASNNASAAFARPGEVKVFNRVVVADILHHLAQQV